MNRFGEAWLLDKMGNCIDVYAHPSESFEFESMVDIVSRYRYIRIKIVSLFLED